MMSFFEVVHELNTTSCSEASPARTTARPSFQPTIYFTSARPTESPSPDPTTDPSPDPTTNPTVEPTRDPTRDPTEQPTDPTHDPTVSPSPEPTLYPTVNPSMEPTAIPSSHPTAIPTGHPTKERIASTVFVTTNLPTTAVQEQEEDGYHSVFGVGRGQDVMTIDLIITAIIAVIIILGALIIYCCWKRSKRYKPITPNAKDAADDQNGGDRDLQNTEGDTLRVKV